MARDYTGYEISRTRDFNPDTGQSLVLVFAGTRAKMQEIAAYYEVAGLDTPIGYGYKTSLVEVGSSVILTVRIPDDILYTEKWQLASSPEQIPIWRDLQVRDFIPAMAGLDLVTDPTGRNLRSFMWRVGMINRGALNIASGVMAQEVFNNATPPTGADNLGEMSIPELQVMFQIVREGPYMDWKRAVLKRQRYIPSVNVADRTRLVGRAQLYSLDGIANIFGIPDDNYDQAVTVYDNLPDAYPNSIWSWKLGRDDSEGIVGAAKVLECKEWTFGLWSTITNTFIE